MFVAIRAVIYATTFIGVVLVLVPNFLIERSGAARNPELGVLQIAGLALAGMGGVLALWCVASFIALGRGTPAPFDPPRRFVARGPYRFVRNPMYVGAGFFLIGLSVVYSSVPVLLYCGLLWLITHLFVTLYEEPTLRQKFGEKYESYCTRVGRWLPRKPL